MLDTVDRVHREVAVKAISSYSDFADVRAVAARGYGCDPDEIVITHNTSDGMSKILAGLALKEGTNSSPPTTSTPAGTCRSLSHATATGS